MSIRQWTRFRTAFFIGVLFFLGIATAKAETDWKSEIMVNAWCFDISIPQEIIDLDARGEVDAANQLALDAIDEAACIALPAPMGAAFKPIEEADVYESFGGNPGVIIRGNMINADDTLGDEAYVVVPLSELGEFKAGDDADKINYQNT